MRKTILVFTLLLAFLCVGKAQNGFIGGGLTLFFSSEGLVYQNTIHGGYEFNDKVAVIAMGGIMAVAEDYDSEVVGETGLYLRLTALHKNSFYLDIKPTIELAFLNSIEAFDIGIVPSLRFRITPRWEVFADVGAVGARYMSHRWMPRLGINNIMSVVGVNYRF